MFAVADKALLFRHLHGYETVKPIWKDKDGNENRDYQVNSEYVFAYNNKDRKDRKDVYGAKTCKDYNKDGMLMIIVYVQNMSHCSTLITTAV